MRVLVVEPMKNDATLLKRALQAEGFLIECVGSAEEADFRVRAATYDLAILTLRPTLDGVALVRAWRTQGVATPILALIGAESPSVKVRVLEAGADDTLARPFQIVELVAHVRALVRRVHRIYDPVMRIHDLEIDTNTRVVKRAGQTLRLTRKEYALLQFLAFNRGRVVSRAMICEHLYASHDANTSNVVDVFIRYLRGKVDKGHEVPLILTRWGEGYLLRGDDLPAPAERKKLKA